MANENDDKDLSDRLEIDVGGDDTDSIDADREGKNKSTRSSSGGHGADFMADGTVKQSGGDASEEDGEDSPEADANDKDVEADETPAEAVDLGEWDPENEDTGAKFDAHYYTDDGLNIAALGGEVAANAAKEGGKPELNAATYGYLKDRLGVPKEVVDQIITDRMVAAQKNDETFYSLVGGKELYASKMEWASGVYTPAQKERFNAALKAGGEEAQEAVELLNTRWEKAGNKAPTAATAKDTAEEKPAARRFGAPKRPASPAKTTSSSENPAGRGGAEPYANAEEYRKHMREASGDHQLALVKKRLEASTFWR